MWSEVHFVILRISYSIVYQHKNSFPTGVTTAEGITREGIARTHLHLTWARTSNPSVRASRDHALFSDRSTTCKRWYPNCVLMGPQMAPSLRVLKVNSRSGVVESATRHGP